METNCGKCGRPLKDQKSLERGFGPTCWGKMQAAREYDRRTADEADKSDFTYHINTSGANPVVVIEDLDRGGRSVTNNIQAVVEKTIRELGLPMERMDNDYCVVYRDSEGNYDGVFSDRMGSMHIYSLQKVEPARSEQDAVQAALKEETA